MLEILKKWLLYRKQAADSMQIPSKLQYSFSQIRKNKVKQHKRLSIVFKNSEQ